MADELVTIFGGAGFVGRAIISRLCERGYRVRAAVRDPHRAQRLRLLGGPGQIDLVQANLRFEDSLAPACDGAFAIINCAGLLYEKGKQSFSAVHVRGAEAAAEAARAAGARRFIQISAIGAHGGSLSAYARSKAHGEDAVRAAFPGAAVLRPSIVVGEADSFFNRFGAMAASSPILPLPGGGHMRMQPIFVGDLARAALAAIERDDCAGRLYELGGPRIYTFKDLMRIVARETRRKVWLAPIPIAVLAPFAAAAELMLRPLPFAPPLTTDQLELLKLDNVVTVSREPEINSIRALGVNDLENIEAIAARYLWRFRPRGQFEAAPS